LVLENWIDSLGEVAKISPILPPKGIEYFNKNFDLSWINNDKLFAKTLSKKLKFIEENRYQGMQYYVGFYKSGASYVKNTNFDTLNYSESNSRILTLFTYWNVIEYFFPYKYLMDQKWDNTLAEMLPFFMLANNIDDFYLAFQKLTVKLNDSHAVFYRYPSSKKFKGYFSAKCKIIDEKMIVTKILNDDIAKDNDITVGDVITKVNGKTIKDYISSYKDLIVGSNEAAYLRNIVEPILSGDSDNVKLEFLKEGKLSTRTVYRYEYESAYKNSNKRVNEEGKFKILENNIGYVNMGTLKIKDIPNMIEKLKLTKAIVFDIRNYPNGTGHDISNFLNSKERKDCLFTSPDTTYIGRFKFDGPRPCGYENQNNYKGKTVVLINEESQSQSEEMAMSFHTADDSTIIGSQTAGADGNVSDFVVVKDVFTGFSAVGVYYPDRKETQRIGIVPDIEVKPTILGIQQGKDEVLDRALQFIETGK
jgi:C-terminal processing protease CtpA/Prc